MLIEIWLQSSKSESREIDVDPVGVWVREIPRPAGENAGLRDDAAWECLMELLLCGVESHVSRTTRNVGHAAKVVRIAKKTVELESKEDGREKPESFSQRYREGPSVFLESLQRLFFALSFAGAEVG
jgi:hypothetical protein